MPNIPSAPSTPSEYRRFGNPELDSDTASTFTNREEQDETDSASEDVITAFQPLPETDSEISDNNANNKAAISSNNNKQQQNNNVKVSRKLPQIPSQLPQLMKVNQAGISEAGPDCMKQALNFDDIATETDSQPDLSRLHEVNNLEGHGQGENVDVRFLSTSVSSFQGQQRGLNPSQQQQQQQQMQSQIPAGFVNILSLPAMLQNLPEGMLYW